MSEQRWIDEQKNNRLFRGQGVSDDAKLMLEISPTNKIYGTEQAKKITAARFISLMLGDAVTCIDELCDIVERSQLCVDGKSREQFMKVAIEQWQGKVAAGKKYIEALV